MGTENKAADRVLRLVRLLLSGKDYTRAEIYEQIAAYREVEDRTQARLFERDLRQVSAVFPVVRTTSKPARYSLK